MEEKKPQRFLGFVFMTFGFIGILLSFGSIIGTVVIVLRHYDITIISLLAETFFLLCSVTTFGAGMMIFRYGEFP
jgi:hypothetical protein